MIALTGHAIERYQSRIRPDLSIAESESLLSEALTTATKMRGRTKYGHLRYLLPDCVLVVKETTDNGLVAVTTYPPPVYRSHAIPMRWLGALRVAGREAKARLDAVDAPVSVKRVRLHRIALEDTELQDALEAIEEALGRIDVLVLQRDTAVQRTREVESRQRRLAAPDESARVAALTAELQKANDENDILCRKANDRGQMIQDLNTRIAKLREERAEERAAMLAGKKPIKRAPTQPSEVRKMTTKQRVKALEGIILAAAEYIPDGSEVQRSTLQYEIDFRRGIPLTEMGDVAHDFTERDSAVLTNP